MTKDTQQKTLVTPMNYLSIVDKHHLFACLFAFLLFTLALPGALALPLPPPSPDISSLPGISPNTVTLISPEQNDLLSVGNQEFTYKTTFSSGTCELYVDSNKILSQEINSEDDLEEHAFTLQWTDQQVGEYAWYVSCTDGSSTQRSSERTFTITDQPNYLLSITLNQETFLPGSFLEAEVEGLSPLAPEVVVLIYKDTIMLKETTLSANTRGSIAFDYLLQETAPEGEYTIEVYNENNASENLTQTFFVVLPDALLSTNKNVANSGDLIFINGEEFFPETDLKLTVTLETDTSSISLDERDFLTDDTGAFTEEYLLNDSHLGNLTLTATQGTLEAEHTIIVSAEPLPMITYYQDLDGDGYGGLFTTQATSVPEGYVTNNDDCNDQDDTIAPLKRELCDGVDNNCNERTDEGNLCDSGYVCTSGRCELEIDSGTSDNTESDTFDTQDSWDSNNEGLGSGIDADDESTTAELESPQNIAEENSEGVSLFWIILPILFVLILAGVGGYAYYEGYTVDDLTQLFKKDSHGLSASGPSLSKSADGTSANHNAAQQDSGVLMSFIYQEKANGYSEGTIREALLKKGWSIRKIDEAFEKIQK